MSIRIRPIVLLALFCLLIMPLAVMAQEDLTETYVSADGFVEFQYPAGWSTIEDEELGTAVVALSNNPDRVDLMDPPEGDEIALLMIPVSAQYPFYPAYEPGASAEDIATLLLDDFMFGIDDDDDTVVMPVEALQVGPYSAAKVSAFDPFDELGFYILILDAETHIMTIIAVAADPAVLTANEATILAVAETFVFTGDPSAIGVPSEAGTISYGEAVTGDLQVDSGDGWTFMGNAGDVVSIALDSDDFDTYVELYAPGGDLIASDDDSGGSLNSLISEFTLPADGTYTINARGFSTTARGIYTLSLTSGAPVDVTGPGTISYGDSVTGDLQVDDGDRWSFSGSAGDVVSIALDSTDFDAYLELYGPDGALIASDDDSGGSLNSLISDFTLPATGTYSINARGFMSSARGVYTLTLTSGTGGQIAPPPTDPGTISYGDSVTGDLQVDDGDRWTFSGSAGDVVSIALDSNDFDAYLELYGPDGTLLVVDDDSGGSLNSLISEFPLPATGTYSINARGFMSSARGAYTLTLTSGDPGVVIEPGTISYGDVVVGDLQTDDGDRWTFSGSAGDIVTIALDSDDFDAYLELLDATDLFLTSDDDSGGNLNSLITAYTLPADGSYTIIARGFGSTARGEYTLSLSLFDVGTVDEPGEIGYGTSVQALLSNSTGDLWTFNAAAGDIVTIALNSDAFDAFLELLDADGNMIASDDDSGGSLNSLISGFTIPEKGEYTIVARAFGSGTGLYTLELSQVDPSLLESAGVLEQGVLIYGNATTIGQRWTYNGTAGERISVLVGGETDIYLELLDPDGALMFNTQDSYNWGHALFDNAELPVTGEYTLIVRARRADEWSDGGYALILGRPPADMG